MEGYNVPQDSGYQVSNSYANIKSKAPILESNYNRNQQSSLPIYTVKQDTPRLNRRSRCPRGAVLGEIGSCCGLNCTRACAIESN